MCSRSCRIKALLAANCSQFVPKVLCKLHRLNSFHCSIWPNTVTFHAKICNSYIFLGDIQIPNMHEEERIASAITSYLEFSNLSKFKILRYHVRNLGVWGMHTPTFWAYDRKKQRLSLNIYWRYTVTVVLEVCLSGRGGKGSVWFAGRVGTINPLPHWMRTTFPSGHDPHFSLQYC